MNNDKVETAIAGLNFWASYATEYNKAKRELIMHRDVTLVANKKFKQTKISQVKRKEIKNCKRSCHTVLKDLSN